ncbi:MAG: MtrB/PioB family decaheme-associated outer membrane protein [Steroidobacteraceae bacterium]
MKSLARINRAWLALGALAALAAISALADTPSADTSDWKCSQCPFLEGYTTETEVGVLGASGANATFGRYTGIDRNGAYADVAGTGQYRNEDGSYANYDLERLGLASRSGDVQGGREGSFDVRVSYVGQPNQLYDTGATPFRAAGSNLGLPANWVAAGSTGGMSALGASLLPLNIESDMRTVALLARYFASPSWTLFGEYRREEHDGSGVTSGSFLTEASQLPRPFDYVTNSFETGVAWAGRQANFRLSYLGSWFDDDNDAFIFANPYLPIVPGSTQGQIADPPNNNLQQFTAAGNLRLPWSSTLTFAASLGTLKQNADFLPVSALPGATVPTPGSLDGDVHLSHYALGLASRPLPKLSVHGDAIYDGHDDKTSPLAIAYIVTDTFPGGTAVTPRYSEDRVHLDGGADYALIRWLKIGVGGTLDEIHYGPGQVATWTQDAQSWGRATITPIDPLSFTLKIGNGLRKASSFDAAALPPDENPLIREFNYAPRDRVFSTLTGAWTATQTLTWSIEGSLVRDDYRSSPLGLQSVHEWRTSSTLAWTPRDTLSAYIDAGYEHLFNLQNGYGGPDIAPWLASDTQRFWNVGLGARWVPQQRWTVTLDYLMAPSYDNFDTTPGGGVGQAFPQNWTKLDSARFKVAYQWTPALQVHFRYTRETYNSSDWAINGVAPATIPNLLALGIQPYSDNVNAFALAVRYQFGHDAAAHAPQ